MDKHGKGNHKTLKQPNPLESIKDIGATTANQMKKEAVEITDDFMEELLGIKRQKRVFSGEIIPGDSIEMNEIFSGKYEKQKEQRKQISLERRLLQEEKVYIEKKTSELRIQLSAIREEILLIAQKTQNLAEETEIAAMQAPIEPGVYHVIFFEKLLEFIQSFRKKIEDASVWLNSVNKRAARKNAWGANYKKYGAKYLLSGEHYLQRSAG